MILEIKPEQKKVLDRAAKSGMSPDEVLDQAFAIIQEQYRNGDWMLADREAVATHVEAGYTQAVNGELIAAEQAIRDLHHRRAKRQIA